MEMKAVAGSARSDAKGPMVHSEHLDLVMRAVDALKGVKQSVVGSDDLVFSEL